MVLQGYLGYKNTLALHRSPRDARAHRSPLVAHDGRICLVGGQSTHLSRGPICLEEPSVSRTHVSQGRIKDACVSSGGRGGSASLVATPVRRNTRSTAGLEARKWVGECSSQNNFKLCQGGA